MPRETGTIQPETPPNWDAIVALLPTIEAADFRAGTWHSPPGALPHFEATPSTTRLIEVLYESGVVNDFDWPAWQKRAERLVRDPQALSRAQLPTLRRLLTVHVRKERFCEGHLAAMLESGHIAAILRRVAELRPKTGRKGQMNA
jgi:hypothetical protein